MFAHIKPMQPNDISKKYIWLRSFLRATALTLTLLLVGEAVPAPAYADTLAAAKTFVVAKKAIVEQQIHSFEVMQDLKSKMEKVTPADFVAMSHAPLPGPGISIIDEVGRLARPVDAADPARWRSELHREPTVSKLSPSEADYFAQRHLWLGGYLLSVDHAPREARDQFRAAYNLTSVNDFYHGQALYDLGLSVFYQHDFQVSVDYYRHMLLLKPRSCGFDRNGATLLLRHAMASLGYHLGNARLGIPEPPTLDPLCGAASLAASLRSLGLAYDRETVVASCQTTEEGNDLQDLIDAGRKLGAAVYPVSADDRGLELMPKPAIAYIEQDHFISVVGADNAGVTYLCSDCGMWPGGQVRVSWNQWHHMSPGVYGVAVRHGSNWDQFFAELTRQSKIHKCSGGADLAKAMSGFRQGIEVCSLPTLASLHLTSIASQMLPVAELVAHLSLYYNLPGVIACNPSGEATHCTRCCPKDGGGPAGGKGGPLVPRAVHSGPSYGDPVNLATGEEEYTPDPDLKVYNPIGPSVTWSRIYNSLREPYYEQWYEVQDFGLGWSQNYNMGVNDPTNGGYGLNPAYDYKYIFMPNGGRIGFMAAAAPTAANPTVQCQVQPGYAYLVSWNFNSANNTTYYVLTDSSRTQYVTSPLNTSTLCCVLVEIVDQNGNAIHLNYSAPGSVPGYAGQWPLLSSITDSNGSPLLVINRVQDGTGAVASVDDRYGRTVYYHVGYYEDDTIGLNPNIYGCDHVSQIVPTDTANPPDRYQYGYTPTANSDSDTLPKLSSISVPNPSGSPTPATATIQYGSSFPVVASITDAEGNERSYSAVTGNETQVTVTGSNMQTYSYSTTFNSNFSPLTNMDGVGNITEDYVYNDPNDPYRPSSSTDGNGKIKQFKWDQFGNLIEEDSRFSSAPGAVGTDYMARTFEYNYSNFALGEMTSAQTQYVMTTGGGTSVITQESPTTYTYCEPSGRVESIVTPLAGTSNSSLTSVCQFSYNSLGDVTQAAIPGNQQTPTIIETYNYGPAPAEHEPLERIDDLGHVTQFMYDSQGNKTAQIDPCGNETDYSYENQSTGLDVGQLMSVTYPPTTSATNERAKMVYGYAYPGGPTTFVKTMDELGNGVREVDYSYGSEGEKLLLTGSTQQSATSYDGLYRPVSFTDANGNITHAYYNSQGYLNAITYPGYSGPVPAFNSTTESWSNVTGPDSLVIQSYDAAGNELSRIDGRGVFTHYTYNDPDNLLTSVQYSLPTPIPAGLSSTPNISYTYDSFGRQGSVDNGVTRTTFGAASYDDGDRPLNVETSYYNDSHSAILFSTTLSYNYNADGSTSSMQVTPGDGTSPRSFSYQYDAGQRMVSMANTSGEETSWTYYNNDWVAVTDLGKMYQK